MLWLLRLDAIPSFFGDVVGSNAPASWVVEGVGVLPSPWDDHPKWLVGLGDFWSGPPCFSCSGVGFPCLYGLEVFLLLCGCPLPFRVFDLEAFGPPLL